MILIDTFRDQAKKTPEIIALSTESKQMTYRELDGHSDFVAAHLLQHNVTKGHIGLLFEQGTDMVVSSIATLKAGLTYIPLSDQYPELRIAHILEDAEVEVLVTNHENMKLAKKAVENGNREIQIINVDELSTSVHVTSNYEGIQANEYAYILYTSGSTGKPKGVIQTQENIYYYATQYANKLGISSGSKMTLFSYFSHDAAIIDIYSGLLHGATLYPRDIRKENGFKAIVQWLAAEKMNIWHSVPTLYRHFTRSLDKNIDLPDLKYIILGGENVNKQDIQLFRENFKNATLVNLYGQSESSFNSCQFISHADEELSIHLGRPIEGIEIIVVDEFDNEVLPLGIGEIVVSNSYIAKGYWNNKELSAKVFQNDPEFGSQYWTGDLGRLEIDGSITWLGRKDKQVKIRGYRIELGEIENCLMEVEAIKDAVVLKKEGKENEEQLIAYYTLLKPHSKEDIKKHLSNRLPTYMIPNVYLEVENIPLTASGKVDRNELLKLEVSFAREKEYQQATNEIEQKLVAIWDEMLKVERIGIQDNFFELGGHSLKATIVSGRIQKELEVEIGVSDLFQYPTIKELATKINESHQKKYEKLQPLTKQESYPVSSAQKRLFAIQMMDKENVAYNMPFALKLEGQVDRDRVEKAIQQLVMKHDSLRTSFHILDEEIVQKIADQVTLALSYEEVESQEEVDETLTRWVQPFDLEQAPLARSGLIKWHDSYILMIDIHHIISDGTTMGILAEDFMKAYEGEELEVEEIQYKEYVLWEREKKTSGVWEEQKAYWKQEFEGVLPVLNLPLDGVRSQIESNVGNTYQFMIEEEVVQGLSKTMSRLGGTLYMGLMAGYSILISKYSGQEDIVIGTPIAGRRHPQLQKVAGMFVNTLAIRNYPEGNKKIEDYLIESKDKLVLAYENQEYAFEELVEEVKSKRDLSRNPLFDVMLVLHNNEVKEMALSDLQVKPYGRNQNRIKLDIILNMIEANGQLVCETEYRSSLFRKETIALMMKHYVNILKEMIVKSDQQIQNIEGIDEEEKQQLLQDFNDTQLNYTQGKTLIDIFEETVRTYPTHIAVAQGDTEITYEKLLEKVNKMAQFLMNEGVQIESIVGLMVDRSIEMIVAMLAIQKAGGAYLPIDKSYPKDRIEHLLMDSESQYLLTDPKRIEHLNINFTGTILDITNYENQKIEETRLEKRKNELTSKNLAYVIYTSGSTGNPKGVMIEHQSLHNLILGMRKRIPLQPGKSILALTTISFDLFVSESLVPLALGMKVIVANEEQQKDPALISELILRHKIDMLAVTPSRMLLLTNDRKYKECLQKLEVIMMGGEALPENLIEKIQNNTEAKIFNLYGPTEATVWSTVKELKKGEKLTIGTPISNTKVYIVNSHQRLAPTGTVGELCIAGDGLARGYMNLPSLTAEKFIENPYVSNERMYKTGDLARWTPQGTIEYIGRIDHQIKIRGYRIELGEIDAVLRKLPEVKDAVTMVKENKQGNKYLCAYIVTEAEYLPTIKNSIKKQLPDYMVPTAYVTVFGKIPLTHNGKVNKQALSLMEEQVERVNKIPPRSFVENTIATIWKKVLDLDEVFIHDDFFEFGGNSINIIQVAANLRDELDIDMNAADIMANKTILELSEYITEEMESNSNDYGNRKHVFKINRSKSEKKIFIVHGADGNIFYFRHLAKLLEDKYSVYGIQPRGLNGEEPFPDSYYQMLQVYIDEIRQVQSEGPYLLAGYCVGGYLSNDLANIMQIQGDEVSALLMLDQEAFIEKKHHKNIRIMNNIIRVIDLWRRITKKDKSYTMKTFSNLIPKAKPIEKERQLEILKVRRSIQKFFGEELTVKSNYCFLGFVYTPTLVIKAVDNDNVLFKRELWEKMAKTSLEYYEVPGDHDSVLMPPNVDAVGEIVRDYLQRKNL
ncbi:non-ribosomal peptide synthetase [Mesobacillus zeae]|uniref:non-ribosomal peptide synthetase n=1 Tax=Mesobacillus zeae TaxID=1917180 RepID=UPI0015E6F03A|nr:non-ribosomal peptide synthetase [Mesobacillus zeae]